MFFVLSRELPIVDLKLTNLSHQLIGKSYQMEKNIKRYKIFHSTQLSGKRPQVLSAYCTDTMIVTKVKLHLFSP